MSHHTTRSSSECISSYISVDIWLEIVSHLSILPDQTRAEKAFSKTRSDLTSYHSNPVRLRNTASLAATCYTLYSFLNPHIYRLAAKDRRGEVHLSNAARLGLKTAIDKLLDAGAILSTPSSIYPKTESALHVAARNGHAHVIRHLKKLYADQSLLSHIAHLRSSTRRVDKVEFSCTPLDVAARNGHLEVVKLLHDIPMPDDYRPQWKWLGQQMSSYLGWAMQEAIKSGHLDILRFLFDKGADPMCHDVPSGRPHSLLLAFDSNRAEAAELLIDLGVDIGYREQYGDTLVNHICDSWDEDLLKVLFNKGVDIWAENRSGHNLLGSLFCRCQPEQIRKTVSFLVERGIDINHADSRGNSALHYAARYYMRSDTVELTKFLIDNGANASQLHDFHLETDRDSVLAQSPIGIALKRKDLELVEYLKGYVTGDKVIQSVEEFLEKQWRDPSPDPDYRGPY